MLCGSNLHSSCDWSGWHVHVASRRSIVILVTSHGEESIPLCFLRQSAPLLLATVSRQLATPVNHPPASYSLKHQLKNLELRSP